MQVRDALDRPLHDLRISLLDRCNFRCPYCMPETEFHEDYKFLSRSQRLTHEEILKVAGVATRLGVSKLRLTGGEPLLDKKLPELVAGLVALPGVDDLALTTNAMLLAPVAQKLADAGLHRVTISLDSLDEEVFRAMSGGRGDLGQVMQGVAAAEQASTLLSSAASMITPCSISSTISVVAGTSSDSLSTWTSAIATAGA